MREQVPHRMEDDPREVNFLYANSYEREAAAQLFEMAGNASCAGAL